MKRFTGLVREVFQNDPAFGRGGIMILQAVSLEQRPDGFELISLGGT